MAHTLVHEVECYSHAGNSSRAYILDQIATLIEISPTLRTYNERPLKDDDILDAEVVAGIPLWRLLYENSLDLPRDLLVGFMTLIDQLPLMNEEQKKNILNRAALGIYPTNGKPFIQNVSDWFSFRRGVLKLHKGTPLEFHTEAQLLFPKLLFSTNFPDCLETLEGGFKLFPAAIVSALTELNDHFILVLGQLSITEGLRQFSAKCGFETTMEGNARRHNALTFPFRVEGQPEQRILCEPHMKIHESDIPGDGKYYFNRIYFNPARGIAGAADVIVGHVGKHL